MTSHDAHETPTSPTIEQLLDDPAAAHDLAFRRCLAAIIDGTHSEAIDAIELIRDYWPAYMPPYAGPKLLD